MAKIGQVPAPLDTSGANPMTGALTLMVGGTAASPALVARNASDTAKKGMYDGGADILGFSTKGTAALTINASQLVTALAGLTAQGGAVTLSPANFSVGISPSGTGSVTINPATAGTINNMAIGGTTPLAGTFTGLTATGAVSLSPANQNVTISPTGTGTVTINPATAGSINNMVIGGSSAGAGTFTSLTATGAVSLSPANQNVVISPTGSGLVTINPATAGTLNNVAIGGTTPLAGTFTALTATGAVSLSPANANVTISPTGTGTVTVNPAVAGTIDNVTLGGTTPQPGTFTTVTANVYKFSTTTTTASGNGFYLQATNTVGFSTNGTNAGVIDSSQRWVIGGTANVAINGSTPGLEVLGTAGNAGIAQIRWSADSGAPIGAIGKSRGATVGSTGAVVANDFLGQLAFTGDDGSGFANGTGQRAAVISVLVDGTVAANQVPGRMTISTATSGGTMTEAVRINSAQQSMFSGLVAIGSNTAPTAQIDVNLGVTAASWGASGIGLHLRGNTYTDNSTSGGTVANEPIHVIGVPTLAFTNAAQTATSSATLYIAGAPTAGTNATITNAYALEIATGNMAMAGLLSIGQLATPSAQIDISAAGGGLSAAAWGTAGIQLRVRGSTYTDTSSSGGPITNVVFVGFANPTLQATNQPITYTNAATVYIAGAPTAGTGITFTNPYALLVAAGAVKFGGALTLGTAQLLSTSVSLTNNAAANTATLTNAPASGNPTKWFPINDNGTVRNIPAW